MLFLIFFAAIIAIGVYIYLQLADKLKFSATIPSSPSWPIIGHGLLFLNKTPPQIMDVIRMLVNRNGKFQPIWFGPFLVLLISDPKLAETILSSNKLINKSQEYEYLESWLADGLLLSTGNKWFKRRKVITPTFHFKILEQFTEVFDKQGDTFIKNLKQYSPKDEVDLFPLVTLYALDVICESAMGISVNAQVNSSSAYVRAVQNITKVVNLRIFLFFYRFKFIYKLSSDYRMEKRALKVLHGFTDNIIVERRNELLNSTHNKVEEDNDVGLKKRSAFLDVLLQSTVDGKPLSNLDIREEVDTFMFEGHDTTKSAISFALHNIAKYPEVQEKILAEIKDVFGDNKSAALTLNDLNKMKYLDLVIKETLRLFPSVPLIGRRSKQAFQLNEHTIPKNTNIVIDVCSMGRDSEMFDNPEEFIPERFSVERNVEQLNPYAYVPFSAGPRNCIGQKFAMLEVKSILTKIVRNYELRLPERLQNVEPVLVMELILRPWNGVVVHLKERSL